MYTGLCNKIYMLLILPYTQKIRLNVLERVKYVNKLLIVNLNINSVAGKFYQLKVTVQGKHDILDITETKLDSSFPNKQILVDGFSDQYRLDRNIHVGGLLF